MGGGTEGEELDLAYSKGNMLATSVLSTWQVPNPGLTKTDLGLAILLNN